MHQPFPIGPSSPAETTATGGRPLNDTGSRVLWWNDGHAVRTRFLDALSLMLPSAEQFLIETMQDWMARHGDTGAAGRDDRRPVAGFMAEERAHQRAHRRYNQRLHDAGLPARRLEARIESAVEALSELPLAQRLALASALEHLTAVFAREVLRGGSAWLTAAESAESRMWRWHAQEELAHSDVVFDVLPGAGVSRRHKALAVALAAVYLAHDTLALTVALCAHDARCGAVSRWRLAGQALDQAFRATPSLFRMAAGTLGVMGRALK